MKTIVIDDMGRVGEFQYYGPDEGGTGLNGQIVWTGYLSRTERSSLTKYFPDFERIE